MPGMYSSLSGVPGALRSGFASTTEQVLGRSTGKLRSKQEEQGSQSSKPESGEPSTPGTELVLSAGDLEAQLLEQGRAAIDQAKRKQYRDARDRMIQEHYRRRAEKLMEQLWSECRRRTGHTYGRDKGASSSYNSDHPYICSTCNHPSGYQAKQRKKHGINEVGMMLRRADQAAGIEWIPS